MAENTPTKPNVGSAYSTHMIKEFLNIFDPKAEFNLNEANRVFALYAEKSDILNADTALNIYKRIYPDGLWGQSPSRIQDLLQSKTPPSVYEALTRLKNTVEKDAAGLGSGTQNEAKYYMVVYKLLACRVIEAVAEQDDPTVKEMIDMTADLACFYARLYVFNRTMSTIGQRKVFKAMRKSVMAIALMSDSDVRLNPRFEVYVSAYYQLFFKEVFPRMINGEEDMRDRLKRIAKSNYKIMKSMLESMSKSEHERNFETVRIKLDQVQEVISKMYEAGVPTEQMQAYLDSAMKALNETWKEQADNARASGSGSTSDSPPAYTQSGLGMSTINKMIGVARIIQSNHELDMTKMKRQGRKKKTPVTPCSPASNKNMKIAEVAFKKLQKDASIQLAKLRSLKQSKVEPQAGLGALFSGSFPSLSIEHKLAPEDKELVNEISNQKFKHEITFDEDAKLMLGKITDLFSSAVTDGINVDVGSSWLTSIIEGIKSFISRHGKMIVLVAALCACVFVMITLIGDYSKRRLFLTAVVAILSVIGLENGTLVTCFKALQDGLIKTKETVTGAIWTQDGLTDTNIVDLGLDPRFLGKAVGIALFGSVFKTLSYERPMEDFMRKSVAIKKMQEGALFSITFFIDIIKDATNFLLDLVGCKTSINLFCTKYPEVAKYSSKVSNILNAYDRKELKLTPGTVEIVTQMLTDGNKLLQRIDSTNEGKDAKANLIHNMNRLSPITAQLNKMHLFGSGVRQEPVGVMFAGAPGIGKTIAALMACHEIAARTIPMEQLEELLANPVGAYYARFEEQEFWDGWANQGIIFYDDSTQSRDFLGNMTSPYKEAIRIVNTTRYNLHAADLIEKGRMECKAKFLMTTSNLVQLTELQSIVSVEAFIRRFPVMLMVTLKQEYAENPNDPPSEWKLKEGYEIEEFCPHLNFHVHNLYTGITGTTSFTYKEVIELILMKEQENAKKFEQLSAILKKHMEAVGDSRKEGVEIRPVEDKDTLLKVFNEERRRVRYSKKTDPVLNAKVQERKRKNAVEPGFKLNVVPPQPEHCVWTQGGLCDIPGQEWNEENQRKAFGISSTEPASLLDKELKALNYVSTHEDWNYGALSNFKNDALPEPFPGCIQLFDERLKTRYDAYNRWLFQTLMMYLYSGEEGYTFIDPETGSPCDEFVSWVTEMAEKIPKSLFDPCKVMLTMAEWWELLQKRLKDIKDKRDKIEAGEAPASKRFTTKVAEVAKTYYDHIKSNSRVLLKVVKLTTVLGGLYALYNYFNNRNFPESSARHVTKGSRSRMRGASQKHGKYNVIYKQDGYEIRDAVTEQVYPQFGADPTLAAILARMVKSNYIQIYVPKVDKLLGNAIVVKGHAGLGPAHYYDQIDYRKNTGDLKGDDIIRITRVVKSGSKAVVELYVDEFLDMWHKLPGLKDEDDLAAFMLPSNKFDPAPDIIDKFVSKNNYPKETFHGTLVTPITGVGAVCQNASVKLTGMKTYFTSDRIVPTSLTYDICTQDGDCGSLVGQLNKASGKEKWLGMHVGGDKQKEGYAIRIHRELIENIYDIFGKNEPQSGIGIIHEIKFDGTDDTLGPHMIIRKEDKSVTTQQKTKIIPSPLHDTYTKSSMKPAKLTGIRTDEGFVNVMDAAREKYNHVQKAVNDNLLEMCYDSYMNHMTRECPVKDTDRRDVFTMEEAINGIPGDPFFNAIPRSTSPGYPWVNQSIKGLPGKQTWLGNGEEHFTDAPKWKELEKVVNEVDEKAKKGIRCEHIYMDFPKDERRPKEKVDQGKTRLVSGAPLHLSILIRKRFGAAVRWLMANHTRNGICVGINPYGVSWQLLAEWLRDDGLKKFLAGDFSHYDGSEGYVFMRTFLWFCDWFYGDAGSEDSIARETLFLDIGYSIHIFLNVIYQWHIGMPSGNPLTAVLNSWVNNIIIRYSACVIYIRKHGLSILLKDPEEFLDVRLFLEEFEIHVRIATYGDDNVMSIEEPLQDLLTMKNFSDAFKEIGFVYTDEHKSESDIGFRAISEITFLKRGFRKDPVLRRICAPLDLNTILEMPMWTKESDVPLCYEYCKSNVDKALEELSFHDEEIFNEWAPKIIAAARDKLGYSPRDTRYIALKYKNAVSDYIGGDL